MHLYRRSEIELNDEQLDKLLGLEVSEVIEVGNSRCGVLLKKGSCSIVVTKAGTKVYLSWANEVGYVLLGIV